MEYYHNLVTQKSFELLKQLKRDYQFILIGGWAVFLWTHALKSKDIDLVVDFGELEKIRQTHEVFKNDRLKKYEIKIEEIDVDIYATHYSDPGLPAEEIGKYAISKEGFLVPKPEALLVLKQEAWGDRQGTPKGEKDKIDIISLLTMENFALQNYKKILADYDRKDLQESLKVLLQNTSEVRELGFNPHQFSKLKKAVLAKL